MSKENIVTTTPFTKQFFEKHQRKLLFLANTGFGRGALHIDESLPKLTKILPNGVHWKVPGRREEYGFEYRTHNKYAKRLHYEYKKIWEWFHGFDMAIANPLDKIIDNLRLPIPSLNLGFDSFGPIYPNGSPETTSMDWYVSRSGQNTSFSNIRTGAGTNNDNSSSLNAILGSSASSNQYEGIGRSITLFDTSSLTAGATISTATISLYGNAKYSGLGTTNLGLDIVSSNPASNTVGVSADYSTLGTTSYATKTYANFSTSAYNDFALDSNGIANINKTGISKFGQRFTWDTSGSSNAVWATQNLSGFSWYSANDTGTSRDPKLTGTGTGFPPPGGAFLPWITFIN